MEEKKILVKERNYYCREEKVNEGKCEEKIEKRNETKERKK